MSKRLDAYIVKQDAALIADTEARLKKARGVPTIKAHEVRCQDVPMIKRLADRLHTERSSVLFDRDRLETKLKYGNKQVAAQAMANLSIAAGEYIYRLRELRVILKLRKRTCRK
jgi:hypothetical protein